MTFRQALLRRRRQWLEDWIEHAIALLDEMDDDADAEIEPAEDADWRERRVA